MRPGRLVLQQMAVSHEALGFPPFPPVVLPVSTGWIDLPQPLFRRFPAFTQFPLPFLTIADRRIGPVRQEHDTTLRGRGPWRPGILSHRYRGPYFATPGFRN
jgi:hypothetical protein